MSHVQGRDEHHAERSADFARRVKVEQRLLDAATGKAEPPTREECRELASTLGVPADVLRCRVCGDVLGPAGITDDAGATWVHLKCHAIFHSQAKAEIRLDDRGELDEVCAPGGHLERMDRQAWFLELGDVAVWLRASHRITVTYERREPGKWLETRMETLERTINDECEWLAQERDRMVAMDENIRACMLDQRRSTLASVLNETHGENDVDGDQQGSRGNPEAQAASASHREQDGAATVVTGRRDGQDFLNAGTTQEGPR